MGKNKVYVADMENFVKLIEKSIELLKINLFNGDEDHMFNQHIILYMAEFLKRKQKKTELNKDRLKRNKIKKSENKSEKEIETN